MRRLTVKESLALLDEARSRKDWKEADTIKAILNCQYFDKVSIGEDGKARMVPNPAYMELMFCNQTAIDSYAKDREREFEKAGLPKDDWWIFFQNGNCLITE